METAKTKNLSDLNSDASKKEQHDEFSLDGISFDTIELEALPNEIQVNTHRRIYKGKEAKKASPVDEKKVIETSSTSESKPAIIKCSNSEEENTTANSNQCEEYKNMTNVECVHTEKSMATEKAIEILKFIMLTPVRIVKRLDAFSVLFTLACVALTFLIELAIVFRVI